MTPIFTALGFRIYDDNGWLSERKLSTYIHLHLWIYEVDSEVKVRDGWAKPSCYEASVIG